MTDALTFRPLRDGEFAAFADVLDVAFNEDSGVALHDRWEALLPAGRIVAAFDGERLVGTSGAYEQRLSVPGGELACAGITVVTVLPTHRRRGILTRMMATQLAQARAAGEPLSALWSAEGGIYERFGYGVAVEHADVVLPGGSPPPRRDVRPLPPSAEPASADAAGTAGAAAIADPPPADAARTAGAAVAPAGEIALALHPLEGAGPLLDPLWERMRARRGGMPARTDAWWARRILADLPEERHGARRTLLVLARDGAGAGAVQGYALYRARGEPEDTRLELLELVAPDPDVEAVLWAYFCGVDLVRSVEAAHRPVDDPAPLRFADYRQPRVVSVLDALWLRLLDLPVALAGRAWAAPADLVLEVADAQIPENGGRWRLEATAEGDARCTRSDRAPDLVLDAAALGAAFLGGVSATRLADAGRIAERTPGALTQLDAALHVPRAPWCPEHF